MRLAKAVRRRRRTVLAGAASVVAVLVATGIAVGSPRAAGPPAAPGPTAPLSPSHPPASPCHDVVADPNAGARAWGLWVRGKLGVPVGDGAAWFSRTCAVRTASELVPTRTENRVEVGLADRPRPGRTATAGSQMLIARAIRWERLPDAAWQSCQDSEWIKYVACYRSTLADGSLVVQRDYYDIPAYQGLPVPAGRQPAREVTRFFPDGRALSLHLSYTGGSGGEGAFARMARTREELTAIVTDPAALRYFPRP